MVRVFPENVISNIRFFGILVTDWPEINVQTNGGQRVLSEIKLTGRFEMTMLKNCSSFSMCTEHQWHSAM